MNLKRLGLIACVFTAGSALAAEDLYPCNVQVRRPKSDTKSGAGGFYARVQIEDLLESVDSPLRLRWATVVAPSDGRWASLVSEEQRFRYDLRSVQLARSAEDLGVSYRVDFCYVGPTATTKSGNSGANSTRGRYDLVGTLQLGEGAQGADYQGLLTGSCDLREVGAYKGPATGFAKAPSVIEGDARFSIELGSLGKSELSFDQAINSQDREVPRYCALRLEVVEDARGVIGSDVILGQPQIFLQIDRWLR